MLFIGKVKTACGGGVSSPGVLCLAVVLTCPRNLKAGAALLPMALSAAVLPELKRGLRQRVSH